MTTSGAELAALRRAVRRAAPGLRRDLPWIGHPDPWAVYVSEVMLQQTSVARVLDPWRRFLDCFPTPAALAKAPLADVLRAWEGLGYHRRARHLHEAAKAIVAHHGGQVPSTSETLRTLPGIGEYSAAAIASFAFGERVGVLDTNVGRILARAGLNRPLSRSDAREAVASLLPRTDVAAFNQALLDLGAGFCTATPRCENCPVATACRWRAEGGVDPAPGSAAVSKPQAAFAGSVRQVRGRVLAALREKPHTGAALRRVTDDERIDGVLDALAREGMIERTGRTWRLAGD